MAYQVEFLREAEDDLSNLDASVRERIFKKIRWLADNFESITSEPLTGEFKGYFKLRIGDYRVIYAINSTTKLIVVRLLGHRKEIYK